jgi:hypothetical protein
MSCGGGVDVFVSERQKVIASLFELMDKENPNLVESAHIMENPCRAVVRRLERKCRLERELAAASSFVLGQKKDKDATVGEAVVGAAALESSATAKVRNSSLKDWWVGTTAQEKCADGGNDADGIVGLSIATVKLVMAAANHELAILAAKGYGSSRGIVVVYKDELGKDGKDKKRVAVEIVRKAIASEVGDVSDDHELEGLPFFGRVVDSNLAAHLPRATTLPLKLASGDGPDFFIDGSQHLNIKKSDCCIPFLIQPLPVSKKEKDVLKAASSSSGCGDTGDVATASVAGVADSSAVVAAVALEPQKKKAKKSIGGGSYEIVATHVIDYVPMPLNITTGDGATQCFDYLRPVLRDLHPRFQE